ncbi:cytochrome c biogenesis heme-transporting ATPase CcmA [Legionella israelensis]|nr:cytochrome c biogenesis heme-transporting ATPase CcmA [Legionella israelensis]QBR83870.1 cytochrome c biogenesis heme-transporting ATPase CcmA [Legionella israelensis]QBS10751.1 cytochrome c biogenesis heme-transporting ATPase CcmA [Legionella israelensis]
MLEVEGLEFEYCDMPLLKDVSFTVQPGDLLHLRGANGAGKTTLLRLLAGLFYPIKGEIRYRGKSIHPMLEQYQKNICLVGHKSGINPLLTVKENIYFDLKYNPGCQSLNKWLSLMSLEPYAHQLCEQLSAGQKRRVSLLRLFFSTGAIWLLDEPLVALDVQGIDCLVNAIGQHRDRGGIVILTSHQMLPDKIGRYQEYRI